MEGRYDMNGEIILELPPRVSQVFLGFVTAVKPNSEREHSFCMWDMGLKSASLIR